MAISIVAHGAVQGADNTTAINAALAAGKAAGQAVVVPAGFWPHSNTLTVDSVEFYGEPGAVLYATNPALAAVTLNGNGSNVHHLSLACTWPAARLSSIQCNRIAVVSATNFTVSDNFIEVSAGTGVYVRLSTTGTISRNTIQKTLADSIHITYASSYVTVTNNLCDGCGDDGVAVVSYQAQGSLCNHITATGNIIRNQRGGRGMTVVGGEDVLYENNLIQNNIVAAGLYFAMENNASFQTFGAVRVTARRNTVYNCGNVSNDHTAILIASPSGSPYPNQDITIERCLVLSDRANPGGIRTYAQADSGIVFESNISIANPPYRINFPLQVTNNEYTTGEVGYEPPT